MPATSLPDWSAPDRYAHLLEADRRVFAWEWLRRSPTYRRAWLRHGSDAGGQSATRAALGFSLLTLEDPSRDARTARPIWRSEQDPRVVSADAESGGAADADLFDILRVAPLAHVAIGPDGNEHWLLSNGCWLLRLDIVKGTLLGGPAVLRFRLRGMAGLSRQLKALGDLVGLWATPHAGLKSRTMGRRRRWIAELRTADALEQGASQREIARGLFGETVHRAWRMENDAYRLRVQRLARAARIRLKSPVSRNWFEG